MITPRPTLFISDTTVTGEHHPHGKAAALLAYAIDIESESSLDRRRLDQLLDRVCEDDIERLRLISLLSNCQNPQLPSVVLELLGARLDRLNDQLETAQDMDTIFGVWGQRLAGGAILAGIGFLAADVLTTGWGSLTVAIAMLAGAGTSAGRAQLKRRIRSARRQVDQTTRLIDSIKGNAPKP